MIIYQLGLQVGQGCEGQRCRELGFCAVNDPDICPDAEYVVARAPSFCIPVVLFLYVKLAGSFVYRSILRPVRY